jgi:hypothetical protein
MHPDVSDVFKTTLGVFVLPSQPVVKNVFTMAYAKSPNVTEPLELSFLTKLVAV